MARIEFEGRARAGARTGARIGQHTARPSPRPSSLSGSAAHSDPTGSGPAEPTPTAGPLPCPHFPNCFGCGFIGRPYGEQLALKQERVRDALGCFPSLGHLLVPDVVGSPRAFGYRNQAKLVVRQTRRGLLLGIYRPESHHVVDISRCPVHHPLINAVLDRLREALEQLAIPTYDERTHTGSLRYVVIRVSGWTKRAQIILVTRERALPQARPLVARLRRIPGVVSVVQNINPEPGNVIFGPAFVPLTGDAVLIERVGDFKLQTQAGAFLQANIPVARKLYVCALDWAAPRPEDIVADLYCGAGALSFHLATAAKLVCGIEASPLAIIDAKRNIRLNGFHNLRFHTGEVAQLLPELAQRVPRFDLITLNPPRKGADPAARTAILACLPRRIVYISCNPDTLARDLDWFSAHAYRTTRVQPFDLLPQTDHVECVALLEHDG